MHPLPSDRQSVNVKHIEAVSLSEAFVMKAKPSVEEDKDAVVASIARASVIFKADDGGKFLELSPSFLFRSYSEPSR